MNGVQAYRAEFLPESFKSFPTIVADVLSRRYLRATGRTDQSTLHIGEERSAFTAVAGDGTTAHRAAFDAISPLPLYPTGLKVLLNIRAIAIRAETSACDADPMKWFTTGADPVHVSLLDLTQADLAGHSVISAHIPDSLFSRADFSIVFFDLFLGSDVLAEYSPGHQQQQDQSQYHAGQEQEQIVHVQGKAASL